MDSSTRRRIPAGLARDTALFAGFFVLYALTLTRQYTFDALMFAGAIRAGFFHESVFRTHNMAYLPSAIALRNTLEFLTGRVPDWFLVGQLWSALWGALAVTLTHRLLLRAAAPREALVLALVFGTTNAIWSMATTIEVYTVSTAMVAATALALCRRMPRAWVCGLCWAGAVLGHLTNVLLAVPLLVGVLVHPRIKSKPRFLGMCCGVGGGVTLAIYTIIGATKAGVRSPGGLVEWVVSWAGSQQEYGVWRPGQLGMALDGIQDAFLSGGGLAALIGLEAIMALCVASSARTGLRRRYAAVLLAFLVTYGAFFVWWEPLNIEFWCVPALGAALLAGLGCGRWTRTRVGKYLPMVLFLFLGATILVNGASVLERRDPGSDLNALQARALANRLDRRDLVVTFSGPLVFTLPLFGDHDSVVSIDQLAGASNPSLDAALTILAGVAASTREQGGIVHVMPEAMHPGEEGLARLGVSRESYAMKLREALAPNE